MNPAAGEVDGVAQSGSAVTRRLTPHHENATTTTRTGDAMDDHSGGFSERVHEADRVWMNLKDRFREALRERQTREFRYVFVTPTALNT